MALATKERVSIPEHCVKVHREIMYISNTQSEHTETARGSQQVSGSVSVNLIRKQIC